MNLKQHKNIVSLKKHALERNNFKSGKEQF